MAGHLSNDFNTFMALAGTSNTFGSGQAGTNDFSLYLAMATSETLIGSGNTAYMQLRLHVNGLERERDTIVEEKNQLRKELIAAAAREEVLQDTTNKLIERIPPPPPLQPNGLPQLPQAAAPLESKEYPDVKFWQQKAYQAFLDEAKGETDGMAQSKPKCGHPKKVQDDDDDDSSPSRHPYLEHSDGTSVTHDDLWRIGYALKKRWKILKQAHLLPLYITKTYSSWSRYHHPAKIAAKDKKRKRSDSSSTNDDSIQRRKIDSTPEPPVLNEDGLIPLDDESAQSPNRSSPPPEDDINMFDLHLPDRLDNSESEVPDLFDPLNDIYDDMDLAPNQLKPTGAVPDTDSTDDGESSLHLPPAEPSSRSLPATPPEDEQDEPTTTETQPPAVEPTASTTKKTRVPKALEVVAPGENITEQNITMRFWMALDPANNWLKVDFDAYFAKMPKEEKMQLVTKAREAKKAEKKKDSATSKKAPRKQKQ
ncbi:hypothetical protein EV421DRAFT_1741673 [Armillaria borealis]|uniref:Uncharacterized protein n=1 Tax=Armillaria borealis TaxID=47425 RepID=A0AA39MH77_9AGAR|nr:hypothetical protein EV421DRAFT_1741673 [Armillaria borealis]